MTTYNAASMGSYGSDWSHKGYCGRGPVAELLDCHLGRPALVCGSGEGVFQEVSEALVRLSDPVIFAANDVGMYLPKLDHWVSLHTDNLGAWRGVRWLTARGKERTQYHGVGARPFLDHDWEGLTPLFCLSGYFAMQLAWLMGCAPIVLCGCPGDSTRRFFDVNVRQDFGYGGLASGADGGVKAQIEKEMLRVPEFKAVIRSMAGWTQTVFGEVEYGGLFDPGSSGNASLRESLGQHLDQCPCRADGHRNGLRARPAEDDLGIDAGGMGRNY